MKGEGEVTTNHLLSTLLIIRTLSFNPQPNSENNMPILELRRVPEQLSNLPKVTGAGKRQSHGL